MWELLRNRRNRSVEDLDNRVDKLGAVELAVNAAQRAAAGQVVLVRSGLRESEKTCQIAVASEFGQKLGEASTAQVELHGEQVPHRGDGVIIATAATALGHVVDQRSIELAEDGKEVPDFLEPRRQLFLEVLPDGRLSCNGRHVFSFLLGELPTSAKRAFAIFWAESVAGASSALDAIQERDDVLLPLAEGTLGVS